MYVFVPFVAAAQELPQLTQPVNDFANVVDSASEQAMDSLIRSLEQATGDVVVVATVDTFAPYADAKEYAVALFDNRGQGIGQRGKDNGLLVVMFIKDRRVEVEVGYDLEEFITDGFAGETSRDYMAPDFRRGNYGAGLLAGASRIIGRIAERRNVTLQGVRPSGRGEPPDAGSGGGVIVAIFVMFMVINAVAARLRGQGRRRRWGAGPVSGWHSGVGPFGGGFGGFGGGRSGGGGGGASW